MANTTYSEKLKNPLWQKKRLEILNRDNFTCALCSDTETELHIHHREYIKKRDPWDYENTNFQTLCKHCHLVVEWYKQYNKLVIVASKQYVEDISYFVITSIIMDNTGVLWLSMDSVNKHGEFDNVVTMGKGSVSKLKYLFEHAEKLIK